MILAGMPLLFAQQNGIDQASDLYIFPTGEKALHWFGHTGRSYFVQVSDVNQPLSLWHWMDIIESGNDVEISHEVGSDTPSGFFRLSYTEQVPQAGETLDTADFDQDGLSNYFEIHASPQTHPLNFSTAGDGISDGWKLANGFDPLSTLFWFADDDGDGISNYFEYILGSDPKIKDSMNDSTSRLLDVYNFSNY